MKEYEAEIWALHRPISSNDVYITIAEEVASIPRYWQNLIDTKWEEFKTSRPGAVNNPCFFLQDYWIHKKGEWDGDGDYNLADSIHGIVEQRLFSVNQGFNRDEGLPGGRKASVDLGVAGVFTVMQSILTRGDNGELQVLYGSNAKYGDGTFSDKFKIAELGGGIANHLDVTEMRDRVGMYDCINTTKLIRRKISEEIGEVYLPNVQSIDIVGLTYRDKIPNRGFDMDAIVRTDLESGRIVSEFKDNEHFKGELMPVEVSAMRMIDFLDKYGVSALSKQSLAGMYIALYTLKSRTEADEVLKRINRDSNEVILQNGILNDFGAKPDTICGRINKY